MLPKFKISYKTTVINQWYWNKRERGKKGGKQNNGTEEQAQKQTHIYIQQSTDYQQSCKGKTMEKRQSLQHVVPGQLDIYPYAKKSPKNSPKPKNKTNDSNKSRQEA